MYDNIQQIISQYNVDIVRTYKGRGSTICVTNAEILQLKQLDTSNSHIHFEYELKKNIMNSHYVKVDQYISNIDGGLITEDKRGDKYVIKKWFDGKELDFKNVNEIYMGAGNLAKLHKLMQIEGQIKKEGNKAKDIYDICVKHNKEIRRVREYIRKQSTKTDFESEYLNSYSKFEKAAFEAVNRLEKSNYLKMKEQAFENGLIRHGNYNQHNILNNQGELATVNFEFAHCGIQVMDLYHMLRKVMEKNNWNIELGNNIIEAYNKEKQLNNDEVNILTIMLLYPEKFWKIANQYNNMRRGMFTKRYLDKLHVIIEQDEAKNKFIHQI